MVGKDPKLQVIPSSSDSDDSYLEIHSTATKKNKRRKQASTSASASGSTEKVSSERGLKHGELGDNGGNSDGDILKLRGTNLRKAFNEEEDLSDVGETTELDKYLEDKRIRDPDHVFDILAWWSTQSNNYPILRKMAQDLLAIPVSIVASESAFSTGGRVLYAFRTSMTPRIVEALICTQDWIRTSHHPITIEESLLELEQMEQEGEQFIVKHR